MRSVHQKKVENHWPRLMHSLYGPNDWCYGGRAELAQKNISEFLLILRNL